MRNATCKGFRRVLSSTVLVAHEAKNFHHSATSHENPQGRLELTRCKVLTRTRFRIVQLQEVQITVTVAVACWSVFFREYLIILRNILPDIVTWMHQFWKSSKILSLFGNRSCRFNPFIKRRDFYKRNNNLDKFLSTPNSLYIFWWWLLVSVWHHTYLVLIRAAGIFPFI